MGLPLRLNAKRASAAAPAALRGAILPATAAALWMTIETFDLVEAWHGYATAVYARDIAARLEFDDDLRRIVFTSALLHDLGKVGLAASLLYKPGDLTAPERRRLEECPVASERILRQVPEYAEVATVVRSQCERIDGSAYPDGLAGDEIPLASRIAAVASAYHRMVSDLPFRDGMPSRVARLHLAQEIGGRFDKLAVSTFEAVLTGSTEDFRTARSEAFRPLLPTRHGINNAATKRSPGQ